MIPLFVIDFLVFHTWPFVFQVLDVAVSLAKVADVDRTLGNEDTAVDEFQEAIKLLEALTLKPEETGLEQRVKDFFSSTPWKIYQPCLLKSRQYD